MALVSTMAARPVIVFTNFKTETKLIHQRTWMSGTENGKVKGYIYCFRLKCPYALWIHRISHRFKLLLTQRAGDIQAFGTPPTFLAVGAKGTALITEVDASTRDAICWSWPVSVLYMKYTQHWLLALVSLGTESEWARDAISQTWAKNKS